MSEKKKYTFLVIIFLLIVASAIIGGTFAYLAENLESRANNFNFSNVSIDLVEEEWDDLKLEDKVVYPNRSVPKDPKVKNTGDNNLYAYIEVQIPRANIKTVNQDETVNDAKVVNLLSFDVNDGWELIKSTVSDDNTYTSEIYAYTADIVAPDDETNTLFDKVVFVDMLEGELEKGYQFEMPINAYAIQSDYLEVGGNTVKEKMTNAFEEYQNAEQN